MAVRGTQNYYLLQQIQRRHWANHARQVGLGAAAAERIIADVLACANGVVAAMYDLIPEGFPKDLADSILNGLLNQCARLERMQPGK
jgi:serine/threonine-protein kinase HipA